MTFNALLDHNENPIRMPGEYIILKHHDCKFSLKINEGVKFEATGSVNLI